MNYISTNKTQWDKRTVIHKDSRFYDIESFKSGRNSLTQVELTEMGDVKGKSLLHLQCHFGQDTLSWARLGAKVTGLDLSDAAIELARTLANDLNIDARFVASDVYSTNEFITDYFDLIYTSYGTIVWLDNLQKWAEVISSRLKPGGHFYMVDFHPLLHLYDTTDGKMKYPYFNEGAIEEFGQFTYTDGPQLNMTEITFCHPISDIINSLLAAGLVLEFFNEHDFSPYDCFDNMRERAPREFVYQGFPINAPHLYSMKCQKPELQT